MRQRYAVKTGDNACGSFQALSPAGKVLAENFKCRPRAGTAVAEKKKPCPRRGQGLRKFSGTVPGMDSACGKVLDLSLAQRAISAVLLVGRCGLAHGDGLRISQPVRRLLSFLIKSHI